MAQLLGVVCMDMDMIVPLDTLKSHSGYAAFDAEVTPERNACSRLTVSAQQLETIRAKVSRESVCEWTSHCAAVAGHADVAPFTAPGLAVAERMGARLARDTLGSGLSRALAIGSGVAGVLGKSEHARARKVP